MTDNGLQGEATHYALSAKLGAELLRRTWTITAAESCTGGGFSAALTDVPGSSGWFGQGFVTYSNQAKRQTLGVRAEVLEKYGAVSEEVVLAMLNGALVESSADVGVAISGVAGPDGGTLEKPVGTVCIAWGGVQNANSGCFHFEGGRSEVRRLATNHSLKLICDWLTRNEKTAV